MEYEIIIRKLEPTDLNRNCRFPNTDIEDYMIHKNALIEDLKCISSNIKVSESADTISIASTIEDKYEFWDSIKYLFERESESIKFLFVKQVV